MSIRKRRWKTSAGVDREAWQLDYNANGKRCSETFAIRREAAARAAEVAVAKAAGTFTAPDRDATVETAAAAWLEGVKLEGRERTTVEQYEAHIRLHILPAIGNEKLAKLTAPAIHAFRDHLLRTLSRPMARKVMASLRSILKVAQGRGAVAQNVALGVKVERDKRAEGKLAVGIDIPTRSEIANLLAAADAGARPLLMVATFCGLRASELRGLRWSDVDLTKAEIHVRQRADRFGAIGPPKSLAGLRTVPIGTHVVNTLKEWRLARPPGELVFPGRSGKPQSITRIIRFVWHPVQAKALGSVRYGGLHVLRHFFASWCLGRRVDGGRELPLKTVQTLLGHSSVVMTADIYGHILPRGDDAAELAAAETALLATVRGI